MTDGESGDSEGAMQINEWHLRDKAILAQALKDIYAIRQALARTPR